MHKRVWLKGWLVLLAVFILGGITGASIDWLLHARDRASAASTRSGINNSPPSSANNDYFELLKRELELKPDQAANMKVILDEMRNDYKAVCADVRPRYDSLRERARDRMRVLLSPEQRQRFDLIVTKDDCNCPYLKK